MFNMQLIVSSKKNINQTKEIKNEVQWMSEIQTSLDFGRFFFVPLSYLFNKPNVQNPKVFFATLGRFGMLGS